MVLVPLGFLCEHMEVVFDLDVEAPPGLRRVGLDLVRAGVAGAIRGSSGCSASCCSSEPPTCRPGWPWGPTAHGPTAARTTAAGL